MARADGVEAGGLAVPVTQPVQAGHGGVDPQHLLAIYQQADDGCIAEPGAGLHRHRRQFGEAGGEPEQSFVGADPQGVVGTLGDGVDVTAQRLTVLQQDTCRRWGAGPEHVEAVLRADPQRAVAPAQQALGRAGAVLHAAQQAALAAELV